MAHDAVAAFHERFPGPERFAQIPVRAPIEADPAQVRARLLVPEAEARAQGLERSPWTRHRSRRAGSRGDAGAIGPQGSGERFVVGVVVAVLLGPWLRGVAALARSAWRWSR